MDPVNRHRVWNSIRALKERAIVVLTTHSMEEADYLGDQICLMSAGRIRAMGTSLFLKNRFGSGYQLQLLVPADASEAVEKQARAIFPSFDLISSNGGALNIGIDTADLRYMPQLLQWIEKQKVLCSSESADAVLVKEWSISNSSLEEVFIRLCSAEKTVNAEIQADVQKKKARLLVRTVHMSRLLQTVGYAICSAYY